MKLTNLEIMNIVRGINAAKELVENTFPIKFAWAFQKNIKKLSELSEMIDTKLNALENKYADDEHSEDVVQKDENGEDTTVRVVKPKYAEEFQAEKKEFYDLENEIDIQTFKVDELGDINVSLSTINALDFMLKDE